MDLRQRLHQWFSSRITPRDSMVLTQRNVYIVPSGAGWMLGLTLLVLLIASINYQLNLGYLLTFLLAGCATVGMQVGHGNLRGLRFHLPPTDATFAGQVVQVRIVLHNDQATHRHGIAVATWDRAQWSWTDVPARSQAEVTVAFTPPHRGLQALPTITAETRYPLGTFRVWTLWRPASRVLVYPAPETNPPPLPAGEPHNAGMQSSTWRATDEYDGARPYRRGDPRKLILWKKAAKSDQLTSREAAHSSASADLWLDVVQAAPAAQAHALAGPALEGALSRLCAWVLQAEAQQLRFGLRLAGQEIAPGNGDAHLQACLRALALYGAVEGDA